MPSSSSIVYKIEMKVIRQQKLLIPCNERHMIRFALHFHWANPISNFELRNVVSFSSEIVPFSTWRWMRHCFNGTTMMVQMLTFDGWLFDLIKFVFVLYYVDVYNREIYMYLDDTKLWIIGRMVLNLLTLSFFDTIWLFCKLHTVRNARRRARCQSWERQK